MPILGFVLLSGGIDSTTALALAERDLGDGNVQAISVFYGQRHGKELDHAAAIATHYGVSHHTINLSGVVPASMLTDNNRDIPAVSYGDLPYGISPTYVPYRNGLMLSAMASHVQGTLQEGEEALLYFGAHAEDAQNWAYPDCTPEWCGAMAAALYIGTYNRCRLVVPFQHLRKHEIIALGRTLIVPYELTWSCYTGQDKHCGVCPTCRARKEAFSLAGEPDPTSYA